MKSKPAKSPSKNSIKTEASASTTIQRHALLAAVSLMSLSVGAARAQAVNSNPALNVSPDKATTISDQHKLTSAQDKITSTQNKLTSDQHKVTSSQAKYTSAQSKLTSDQQKLTSSQNKVTSAPIKVTSDLVKQVPPPATGGAAPPQ